MKKLTINRKIWLRGEGSHRSFLRRADDSKMCCVGIYLSACGVSPRALSGKSEATEFTSKYLKAKGCEWLSDRSNVAYLYEANDDPVDTPKSRERKIVLGFKKRGVDVKFVG